MDMELESTTTTVLVVQFCVFLTVSTIGLRGEDTVPFLEKNDDDLFSTEKFRKKYLNLPIFGSKTPFFGNFSS